MSRHALPSKQRGFDVVCGWDTGLATYFAQVERQQADDDPRDPIVLWIGGREHECLDPAMLAEPLTPYADLPPQMLEMLRADQAAAPERTALQRLGASLVRGGLAR